MEKIPETIHESWHQIMQPLFDDPKMLHIKDKLLPKVKWYPGGELMFNVFKMPIDQIKVVILGQDPYHNGSANGYAFAVNSSTAIPASLSILKKEILESKVEIEPGIDTIAWRTLQGWRRQGVFLLNAALTVEVGAAGAHSGQWQWFTRTVIKAISEHHPCIWMLWGSKAQMFEGYIYKPKYWSFGVNPKEHNIILKAPHPAAQTYPNADSRNFFVGTRQFTQCNEILKAKGMNPINW